MFGLCFVRVIGASDARGQRKMKLLLCPGKCSDTPRPPNPPAPPCPAFAVYFHTYHHAHPSQHYHDVIPGGRRGRRASSSDPGLQSMRRYDAIRGLLGVALRCLMMRMHTVISFEF